MNGLSSSEAAERLARAGANEITREEGPHPWRLLAAQFSSPLIWLLLGSCTVAAALGELVDALAIAAIVVLNSLVGFVQEYRSERTLLALRALSAPRARVLRDGVTQSVSAREVVQEDVLALEAGDIVPADARLVEAHALTVNEAALTGESAAVEKAITAVAPEAPLAERTDCVFAGTAVATGRAFAVVFAVGMQTELGKIARLLASAQEPQTPLERKLAQLSRLLLWVCLAVVTVVALLGYLRGTKPVVLLLSSISLAVAAVPEGLPAIVTIALAVGVQRMARRQALVRRLKAVETLGTTTVICTDKTGTLTSGVMTVRELHGDRRATLTAAVSCCDADLAAGTGDAMELALLREGEKLGLSMHTIEAQNPRRLELPFDSTRKRMSVLRADGLLYVKGAPDVLLPLCTEGTQGIAERMAEMASRGLRVLGVAVGRTEREVALSFVGLIGLADPPRPEAAQAVAQARLAGIRTVMITGDHASTARAIAAEMGILRPGDDASETVHARVTAEDKLSIVRGWKARGQVVAMTGDGVNDAPALKEAHIGIAMGKTGTEVTREAADLVLLDDNFATIVAAVQEGRGIYENIRKTLLYMLNGNTAELMVMLGAALLAFPVPLGPLNLLWINLVTDGLPALALVMDPIDPELLNRPPRNPREPLVLRSDVIQLLLLALLEAGVTLAAFRWGLRNGESAARDFAFSTLIYSELFRAFGARSPDKTLWELGAFSNLILLVVITVSAGLQVVLHAVPFTRQLMALEPFSLQMTLSALLLGLIPVTVMELSKLLRRRLR